MPLIKKNYIIIIIGLLSLTETSALESNLPELGNDYQTAISLKKEQMVGEAFMQQIRGSGLLSQDQWINEYLNNLGQRLNLASKHSSVKLNFFSIDDNTINAFAFFGGNIVVHTGLLIRIDNENDLAAVLAHEMAHIFQHHLTRMIDHQNKTMPLTIAELLIAGLVGIGSPELAMHAMSGIMAGHVQGQINFTRENEKEADRVGIQILAKAGFDPYGMSNAFNQLNQYARYTDKPFEYLVTHPLYESRIADANHRAEQYPYRQNPSSLDFHLIRARLTVNQSYNIKSQIAKSLIILSNKKYQNEIVELYKYALLLDKNNQTLQAFKTLKPIAELYPDHLLLQASLSLFENRLKKFSESNKRLEYLLQLYPKCSSLIIQYCEQLLVQNKIKLALQKLIKYYSFLKKNTIYLDLLARSYFLDKQLAPMFEIRAERFILFGNFKNAYEQYNLALDQLKTDKHYTLKINDAIDSAKKLEKIQKTLM